MNEAITWSLRLASGHTRQRDTHGRAVVDAARRHRLATAGENDRLTATGGVN